jgi:hypothetical protein
LTERARGIRRLSRFHAILAIDCAIIVRAADVHVGAGNRDRGSGSVDCSIAQCMATQFPIDGDVCIAAVSFQACNVDVPRIRDGDAKSNATVGAIKNVGKAVLPVCGFQIVDRRGDARLINIYCCRLRCSGDAGGTATDECTQTEAEEIPRQAAT